MSYKPSDFDANPHLLDSFRPKDITAAHHAWDGKVGCAIEKNTMVITSPNAEVIYAPFLQNDHALVLCKDMKWGALDPFQWPQPYVQAYAHFALIMRQPSDMSNDLQIMWWMPEEQDLAVDSESAVSGLGRVPIIQARQFRRVCERLMSEFVVRGDSLYGRDNREWVDTLINQVGTWLKRLENFTSTFSNIWFVVSELQRRWLELRAYVDYMLKVKKIGGGPSYVGYDSEDYPACESYMGALTTNLTVAEEFAAAGVPVWLLRDISSLNSDTRIDKVVTPLEPHHFLQLDASEELVRPVYVGRNDTEKKYFAMFRYPRYHISLGLDKFESELMFLRSSTSTFQQTEEPPLKRLRSDPSSSSQSPTSMTGKPQKGKPGRRLPSLNQFDLAKFDPSIAHPFLPPMLPAWQDALRSVNRDLARLSESWQLGDNAYLFPDPLNFIPAKPDSFSVMKCSSQFITWLHYETAIITMQTSASPKLLSAGKWKDVLLVALQQSGEFKFKANSVAENKIGSMGSLLSDWVAKTKVTLLNKSLTSFAFGPCKVTLGSLPQPAFAKEVLYTLCELNFRSELHALDKAMHIPQTQRPTWSKRIVPRDQLLEQCFPGSVSGVAGGDIITVNREDGTRGLAATSIEERRPFIIRLAQVMSTWQNVPSFISQPGSASPSNINIVQLEKQCATFYAQSFFDRFGRAPTLPRYLEPPLFSNTPSSSSLSSSS